MRLVFHSPMPVAPHAKSASGIRPYQMLKAFRELGHEVWVVDGASKQRAAKMSRVRRALNDGLRFDACYSELSTMPTPLTDPDHLPRRPLLDYRFFAELRREGAPVGAFYRDIYWRFPGYGKAMPAVQRQLALAAYRFELVALARTTDVVFLPSTEMGPYVSDDFTIAPLPPGHSVAQPASNPSDGLRLIYVGGMGDRYRLHTMLSAVSRAAADGVPVSLTVCCHPDQWESVRDEYAVSDAIRVREASGTALHEAFGDANVGVLLVEPLEYWTFAAPVKLFEYLGEGKPIIATEQTLAGDFVAKSGCGWTIPYDEDAAVDLLTRLASHPEEVDAARARVMAERDNHTWRARAQQALDTVLARESLAGRHAEESR